MAAHSTIRPAIPFTLAMLLANGSVLAGAPTLLKGAAQIITTGTFTVGERVSRSGFGASGEASAAPRRSWRKDEMEALAEYGLLDGLTIMFSPRLTVQSASRFSDGQIAQDVTLAPAGKRVDLGASARLGFRARLFSGARDVVSVELSGRGGALASDIASPVMTRAAELEARLLWQRQFSIMGKPSFVDVQAGYRHMFTSAARRAPGESAGEAVVDLTLGVHVTPRLMLLLQNFSVFQFDAARDGSLVALQDRHGAGRRDGRGDAHKLQASLAWKLTPLWTVQAGVLATYAGSTPWRERGVIIAMWRRFGG